VKMLVRKMLQLLAHGVFQAAPTSRIVYRKWLITFNIALELLLFRRIESLTCCTRILSSFH
jgi:hypothetical protein